MWMKTFKYIIVIIPIVTFIEMARDSEKHEVLTSKTRDFHYMYIFS